MKKTHHKVKNRLAQLANAERHIIRFQKLSSLHERALIERNDQLDFTWKNGYDVGVREVSQAVKREAVESKIALTVAKPAETESEKIQQLRLQLSTRESELDQLTLEHVDLKQKLLDQAKRHQQRIDELKAEIAYKPEPIMTELGSFTNTGFMVGNWRNSWKWFSTWAFLLIVFIATVPIPEQFLAVLPEHIRQAVVAAVAIVGWVLRFINQTQPVPLPPAE